MSATEAQAITSANSASDDQARWSRVDAPHPVSLAGTQLGPGEPLRGPPPHPAKAADAWLEIEEPTPEMLAAVAGLDVESRREQLNLQASQLAGHLRERLREVDRREATVNARLAQLESDLRTSRLWLREREMAFQDREHELKCQIEELQAQATPEERAAATAEGQIEALRGDLESRAAEIQEREHQVHLREDELRERRFEFDRQEAALRHSQQLWQQQRERQEQQWLDQRQQEQHDLEEQRQRLFEEHQAAVAQRDEQLHAAELLLNEHAQQLDRDRTELATDRSAWDDQKSTQRQAIEELRAAAEGEMTDRRARLQARQEWIERQKAGLDQVRDEALRLHRQSLEMRLLAEQLWAQITGNLTPAEVTQAIAQLRLKLAEQYRLEEQLLVGRRNELIQLSERLTQQHAELEQLRTGLREWTAARESEIQRQAETLVQRELALDAQHDEYRTAQQEWNSVRRRYEQQIRELTNQLRTLPVAA